MTLTAPFDFSEITLPAPPPAPRYYVAHNLVIDCITGRVVAEFRYQCRRATAINAQRHADRLNAENA